MDKPEINHQAGESSENGVSQSLIHNCKLRGSDESFADAVRQGEAAQDEQSRAKIVAMLKKASRS